MPRTTTMTVRLPAQVKARLENLAKSTDRSKAYLASQAIQAEVKIRFRRCRICGEKFVLTTQKGPALIKQKGPTHAQCYSYLREVRESR